jgi:hypothetical protein
MLPFLRGLPEQAVRWLSLVPNCMQYVTSVAKEVEKFCGFLLWNFKIVTDAGSLSKIFFAQKIFVFEHNWANHEILISQKNADYYCIIMCNPPYDICVQVVLCFSPVGSTLRVRSRKFPAIVNCTSIDWFHEWPEGALCSVSYRFLLQAESELLTVSTARHFTTIVWQWWFSSFSNLV